MKIDIILRTCDSAVVHTDWRTRYCNMPKNQLLLGCLKSLLNSAKVAAANHNINLIVLDDHSTEQTVQNIKSVLSENARTPNLSINFIELDKSGYNNSAHCQWDMCRTSQADLVYSVEDDYLHIPSAIKEMIESYNIFEERLKHSNIVIYPFDEPSEYNPPSRTDYVVHGSHRHWRTGIFTTHVLMSRPKLFSENWELFSTLALKYNGDYLKPRTEHYEESNTIWPLWNGGKYIRFNPVPSLALHMQFDQQKDPFIDWVSWWTEYAV